MQLNQHRNQTKQTKKIDKLTNWQQKFLSNILFQEKRKNLLQLALENALKSLQKKMKVEKSNLFRSKLRTVHYTLKLFNPMKLSFIRRTKWQFFTDRQWLF